MPTPLPAPPSTPSPTTARAATAPGTPPDPDVPDDRRSHHDALDEALVAVRRALMRPGFRRRLLDGLPGPLELATLRLLRTVQRHDGPPSIGAVAEVLAVDPSTASRVVDRAVEAGLLERRACADDRRRARLHLTVTGTQLLDRVTRRRRELLAEVTHGWDDAQLAELVRSLQALIAGFDQLEGSV